MDNTTEVAPVTSEQLQTRLRRIEGQVRGIARMLDEGRTCEDVVTQLMAIRSSIDTVGAAVLDQHLCGCIDPAGDPQQQVTAIRQAMRLWWRFAPAAGSAGAEPSTQGAQSPLPVD
ncbi:MAG: transcriptional regulator [Chloroflexi bacterium]|nr:transcriptional regulator [Chloroflexota bacterium]